MTDTTPKMVTVLGNEYVYDSLSQDVKNMIALYSKWKRESDELKMQYMKSEGACRDLAREMGSTLDGLKLESPYTTSTNDSGGEVVEFK